MLLGEGNSIPGRVLLHARAGMARFTCLNPRPNFQALPPSADPTEMGLKMCVFVCALP